MASQAMAGRHNHFLHLTKDQYDFGLSKIKERIDEHKLDIVSPKTQIIGRSGKKKDTTATVGTDRAVDVSIVRYDSVWRSALAFCIEVADYDSAMLFARDLCPKNPLPMSAKTAIDCLRFHVQERGTILRDHKTNLPIESSFTKLPLICLGVWRSKNRINLYHSALSKVHMHYDSTSGEYCDECNDCHNIPIDQVRKGEGCTHHPGAPHYWRKGRPTTTPAFQNNNAMMNEYVATHYDARHTIAFLPSELRDMRLYLLSINDKYKLMIWTIMLVGIKAFLRIDEALNLEVEDLPEEYLAVTRENVEGLCITVQGKTDKEMQYLAIWDDTECPDLSPSCALLIWLAISGITSGKLFPSWLELQSNTKSPIQSLPYKDFLKQIKYLCTKVLKKVPESPSMRKLIVGPTCSAGRLTSLPTGASTGKTEQQRQLQWIKLVFC